MGDAGNNGEGQITLYTSHRCPWAHRAAIALKELGLAYEEVLIDLDTPRPEWFLKLNPRGLVPTVTFTHPSLGKPKTIVESGLVVHFLLEAYPHLSQKIWPSPINVEATYFRYRVNFFIDTYFSKVQPHWFKVILASDTETADAKIDDFVGAVREHIEPLLEDARPFFGGSSSLTLAEIQTASFIVRAYDLSDGKLVSESLHEKLDDLPNFSKWARATISKESVTYVWNKEEQRKIAVESLPRMKAKYGALAAK